MHINWTHWERDLQSFLMYTWNKLVGDYPGFFDFFLTPFGGPNILNVVLQKIIHNYSKWQFFFISIRNTWTDSASTAIFVITLIWVCKNLLTSSADRTKGTKYYKENRGKL